MDSKHLNEIQIRTLLQLAEPRHRDYALLALSAYTGLRIGDILKLDVGDVMDDGGRIRETIVLVQSKTKRRITISVSPALRAALRRYLDQRIGVDRKGPLILNEDSPTCQNLDRGLLAPLTTDKPMMIIEVGNQIERVSCPRQMSKNARTLELTFSIND